jgi:hypothetical protein
MIFDRYQRPSAQSQLPDHVDCTKAIGSGSPAVRRSDETRSNRVGCRGVEGAGRMLISLFTESLLDREGTPRSAAPSLRRPGATLVRGQSKSTTQVWLPLASVRMASTPCASRYSPVIATFTNEPAFCPPIAV